MQCLNQLFKPVPVSVRGQARSYPFLSILKSVLQFVCIGVAMHANQAWAQPVAPDVAELQSMSGQLSAWGCQAPFSGDFYGVRQCRIKVSTGIIAARVRPGKFGGPVLVLVHGGPGMGNEYMQPLDNVADGKWTVIDYEQRGVRPKVQPGWNSQAVSDSMTFDDLTADLEALRVAVQVDKFSLLGHSFGTVLSVAYTSRYPEHVQALILANGVPAKGDQSPSSPFMMSFGYSAKVFAELGIDLSKSIPKGDRDESNLALPAYMYNPKAPLPKLLIDTKNSVSKTNAIFSSMGDQFDFSKGLEKFHGKTLVIGGSNDLFNGSETDHPKSTEMVARQFSPAAPIIVIPESGHFPWLDSTTSASKFDEAVNQFLNSI